MLAKTDESEIAATKAADVSDQEMDMLPAPLPGDLRRAVRDWAAAKQCALNAVAKQAGIPESTFTAWLGGYYKGNNARIEDRVRVWLSGELNFSRIKAATPQAMNFIQTRTARKVMGALEHAQAMPDIAVITGGAGVGKTSSCQQYAASYSNVWILTARNSLSSPYSMMEYLRDKLGVPETAPFRVAAAIGLKLQGSGGLIIVDEAQHLRTSTFDELRSLHDLAGVGMAFVGNHGVWERINGGGRKAEFAQLFSRVGVRVNVEKSSGADADDILDAAAIEAPKVRKFLRAIAQRPGALRQMSKVLRMAQMQALGAEEELNETHVEAAWNRLSGGEAVAL
jgi:DNA transposition AAA+ family ATPase